MIPVEGTEPCDRDNLSIFSEESCRDTEVKLLKRDVGIKMLTLMFRTFEEEWETQVTAPEVKHLNRS